MPGVTISAGYGAGGSVVAPTVATRLGYPLLDRAINSRIAAQLRVSVDEAEAGELKRSLGDRFLALLTPLAGGVLGAGTDSAPEAILTPDDADQFREQAERIIRNALPGGAVVLGRAGAAALRDEPGVLRVRLFGSTDGRIAQAARIEPTDEATARERLPEVDAARRRYVHRLYRVDIDDPALYHLQLDSTVLPLDTCAELIVTAYRALGSSVAQPGVEPAG